MEIRHTHARSWQMQPSSPWIGVAVMRQGSLTLVTAMKRGSAGGPHLPYRNYKEQVQ